MNDFSSLLQYLSIQKPIQRWKKELLQNSFISINNVNISLISFLLAVVRVESKNFIHIVSDDFVLNDLLFEQLNTMFPEKIGLICCPDFSEQEIENELQYKMLGQKSVELLRDNKLWVLLTTKYGGGTFSGGSYIYSGKPLSFKIGCNLQYHRFIETFDQWGYDRVSTTTHPGSYAVRGCIFDVFPWGYNYPVRIELVENTINSLRSFDPITQRKTQTIDTRTISLYPPYFKKTSSYFSIESIIPSNTITFSIAHSNFNSTYNLVPIGRNSLGTSNFINLNCLKRGPWNVKQLSQLTVLKEIINNFQYKSFLFVENIDDGNKIADTFGEKVLVVSFPAHDSFVCDSLGLFFITHKDIKSFPFSHRKSTPKNVLKIKSYEEFDFGCFLVHENYGIGKYKGLIKLNTTWGNQDCIKIEYLGNDFIYVPIYNLHLVDKYVGSKNSQPRLSRLGSASWLKLKQRTKRSTESIIQAFIELYAKRVSLKGFQFSPDSYLHRYLENSFPYIDTIGQKTALKEIKSDMESEKPMDRILCGDVGFGKTELSIRAAFKAVYDNKLVIVLVPTTILATQHYSSFSTRLSPLGVRVSYLSRFTPVSKQKKILKDLKTNKIDVLIGTHRLLSRDVVFPNLGLLIIDEEHRFGAKHKEKIKSLKSLVDVLSMTATPIPRTLQLSLMGIRNISTIDTPPIERLPIKTSISRFNKKIITDAVNREIKRGGQIYFVHNNIKSIDKMAKTLKLYMPDVRIRIAHGKLKSALLESIMLDFMKNNFQLLLCTTIIEVGIDIPNVNTIFINTAHSFGLSQLYQMRGRVGRSDRQAHCYLLLPSNKNVTKEAMTRLKTIEYYSSLGSGYSIAMKDLELRGAGNLFGVEQSGHISSIGLHMYYKILMEMVEKILSGKQNNYLPITPVEITFDGEAIFPNSYMPEISDRLFFYRTLTDIESKEDVIDVSDEIRDRFGLLPNSVKNLISISHIRLLSKNISARRLHVGANQLQILFNNQGHNLSDDDSIKSLISRIETLGLNFTIDQTMDKSIKLVVKSDSSKANKADGIELCNHLFGSILMKS